MQGSAVESAAVAEDALRDALRSQVDPAMVIDCRHRLATALAVQGRASDAVAQLEASMSWIDEHGDDERRALG